MIYNINNLEIEVKDNTVFPIPIYSSQDGKSWSPVPHMLKKEMFASNTAAHTDYLINTAKQEVDAEISIWDSELRKFFRQWLKLMDAGTPINQISLLYGWISEPKFDSVDDEIEMNGALYHCGTLTVSKEWMDFNQRSFYNCNVMNGLRNFIAKFPEFKRYIHEKPVSDFCVDLVNDHRNDNPTGLHCGLAIYFNYFEFNSISCEDVPIESMILPWGKTVHFNFEPAKNTPIDYGMPEHKFELFGKGSLLCE